MIGGRADQKASKDGFDSFFSHSNQKSSQQAASYGHKSGPISDNISNEALNCTPVAKEKLRV